MANGVTVADNGTIHIERDVLRRLGISPGDAVDLVTTEHGLVLRRADPALSKVYVEPTNGCNLSCRTCIRHSWEDETGVMDMAVYERLIDGLRGVGPLRSISFWGFGEPLMHPSIAEMVTRAKGLGARTQIITNGLLLDRSMAGDLLAAGLDSLVVSVDGASEETHADVRPGADLRAVRRNVDALRRLRDARGAAAPEIGLEFVLMKRNAGEVRQLLKLARSLEASFVIVTHVLPYTREMVGETLYGSSAGTSYPAHRGKWAPEVLLPRIDWRRELDNHILELLQYSTQNNFPPDHLDRSRGYCPFVDQGSLSVGWDGSVSPCISTMHSYSCYVHGRPKTIRRCVFGDLREEAVTDIWNKPEYVAFRDRVRRFDFAPCTDCGGCRLSETNEEDCFGNRFPTCGDCLWAKGVIQCPS